MATPERAIIEGMFMIPDKEGRDVPFILNETQIKLDDNFTGRDIITKARQEGVSSYYLALFTVRCLSKPNTRAVVISHDKESTERLFKRVKYFLENLRGPKPVLETSSKREFSFPKTNSVFYIGTAGARKFGRGDTITDLHCSEVAFWDNAKDLIAGLFQAVPRSGTIGMESTGNGRNFFYRRVMNAFEGKGRYKLHFFNWIDFDEYNLPVSEEEEMDIAASLDPELEEDYLYNEVGITAGQIKFRREKLEELEYDIDLFKQEYPLTIDECFRATGSSIFHKVNYVPTPNWIKQDRDLWMLKGHPVPGHAYLIGADVAGGVGQDNSVAEIIDITIMHQAGEWASNKVPPDIFAHRLKDLGLLFNKAYISVEANNHGIMTVGELRNLYPLHLVHKRIINTTSNDSRLLSLGVYQTSRLKPLALGSYRALVATILVIHSPLLKDEMDNFIEDSEGKLRAEEGCNDDRVMAMATAAVTLERAQLMVTPSAFEPKSYKDPFQLESIIEEMHSRGSGFPIARQV